MAMNARETTRDQHRDRGRVRYRFTSAQVIAMVEREIIGGDVELWDGVLYRMVKGELHHFVTSQVADALRAATPDGYHVREEKSCAFGDRSLPEPDAAICRGRKGDYLPHPPHLARLALVVEVDHYTARADSVDKLRRYAEVGIPVFWRVDVKARSVVVHREPRGSGGDSRYEVDRAYATGDEVPIEVDGRAVGRVAVADLFPLDPAGAETTPEEGRP